METTRTTCQMWNRTEALNSLGRTALLEGEIAEAQRYFVQALTLARQGNLAARLVDSPTGLAQIRLHVGDAPQALRWLAFVLNQPATRRETLEQARRLAGECTKQLDAQVAAHAQAQGKQLTLDQAVTEALTLEPA